MKRIISTIIALVMILSLVSCGNTQKANWSEHLEAGQKFLLDGNYEQAIIEFNKVIEIEPRNVDAYLGLAEVYVAQGDYEKAIEVLEKGYAETESSEIQDRINEIKGIVAPKTEPSATTVTEATTEVTTLADPDQVAKDFAWTIEDGVLTISGHGRMPEYHHDAYNGFPWGDRLDEIKEVIIENGITSIGDSAFQSCTSLTNITIPDSVRRIEDRAFIFCLSLTSITIPDSVTYIGSYAFYCCNSLTSIIIPDSVTSIGNGPFSNCRNLTEIIVNNHNSEYCSVDGVLFTKDMTELIAYPEGKQNSHYSIPEGVTTIRESAFCDRHNTDNYLTSLTSITIPDSVTSIGINPFTECRNLAEINVNINNSEYCSIDGVLFTKDMTELIAYPREKQSSHYNIPEGVTNIGEEAFDTCGNLLSITIPDSVTSIGDGAFDCCWRLTSITIPNSVISIGGGAFSNCDKLTSITIPSSVKSITYSVFICCDKLSDIYCEAESKPADWNDDWLDGCSATVHWGYKG